MGKSKKNKKEKKRARSSSDSGSDEWVETSPAPTRAEPTKQPRVSRGDEDDGGWNTIFSGTTSSKKAKDEKEPSAIIDKPGQHARELNPYWRDGGTGLPQEAEPPQRSTVIGDGGLQWLLRAKRRLEEQSKETGLSVEQLAVERWGSLANLNRKIAEAEDLTSFKSKRPSFKRPDQEVYKRSRRRSSTQSRSRSRSPRRRRRTRSRSDEEDYTRSRDRRRSRERRRSRSRSRERRRSRSREKREDREKEQKKKEAESAKAHPEEGGMKRIPSWMKQGKEKEKEKPASPSTGRAVETDEAEKEDSGGLVDYYMTDEEMNKLAAKVLRAEMMGQTEEAIRMKERLEKARKAKDTVILTRTDSKGLTRPLEKGRDVQGGSSRAKKIPTHQDKQRIRYFGDDDKYSLKDMFEREKLGTAEDQNAMFSRLAGKGLEKTDDDFTVDDVFVTRAQMEENEAKQAEKEKKNAIREHKQQSKALEGCSRCIGNKETLKHLIIAVGSKVYLSLPAHSPLTPGHCLIVPTLHVPCATQVDEDVWEEMQRFRRALVSLFAEEDEDCIFFESAMNLKKWPHMVLECIPLPREMGDLAPIYFKKAILDSESEWAQNKKLVDLRGRDVRKAIPKGLPYFSVDFGNESGFAHVIEDERVFPKNFAQEIIGGMLDLDHSVWRKPKREEFELQMSRINSFTEKWKPYDFTSKSQ